MTLIRFTLDSIDAYLETQTTATNDFCVLA